MCFWKSNCQYERFTAAYEVNLFILNMTFSLSLPLANIVHRCSFNTIAVFVCRQAPPCRPRNGEPGDAPLAEIEKNRGVRAGAWHCETTYQGEFSPRNFMFDCSRAKKLSMVNSAQVVPNYDVVFTKMHTFSFVLLHDRELWA